jgi:hypothetical protein
MKTTIKVIRDIFVEQLKWSWWFMGINLLIHLSLSYYSVKYGFGISDFTQFISAAVSIYMLVIGIVAGSSFLNYYSRLGVTRKDYFYGVAIAAIILSFTIIIVADVLAFIEISIFNMINVSLKSNIFVGMNWVKPTFSISLNGLIYYLIGWFISVGYYKFNWKAGLLFILISFVFSSIHGFVWVDHFIDIPGLITGSTMEEIININAGQLSYGVSAAVDAGLIVFLLFVLRGLTKNVSVKL